MKAFILILVLSVGASFAQLSGKQTNRQVIGTGQSEDVTIEFNNGTSHAIKSSVSSNSIEFTNDGTNFKKLGSGDGGGSGGINTLVNPKFEDGKDAGWTYSPGTVTELLKGAVADADKALDGEKSIRFNPSTQNEFLKSNLVTIPPILRGRECQARIGYRGGDDNYKARVVDAAGNVLYNGVAEITLRAHSAFGYESIPLICPSQADIDADSNKSQYQVEIYQATTTDAAAMDLEDLHNGSLIGLTEVQLPDIATFVVSPTGSIVSDEASLLSGCAFSPSGSLTCDFLAGALTVSPDLVGCVASNAGNTSAETCELVSISPSQIKLHTSRTNESSHLQFDLGVSFSILKKGADSKQSVQGYKTYPKVVELENKFILEMPSSNSPSTYTTNTEWINSCTETSSGHLNCSTKTFSENLSCTCDGEAATFSAAMQCRAAHNGTVLSVLGRYTSGTSADLKPEEMKSISVTCDRVETQKTATENVFLVGQVLNSYSQAAKTKAVTIEACDFTSSGTISNGSKLCGWVDSTAHPVIGKTDINFVGGAFSQRPNCFCGADTPNSSDRECHVRSYSSNSSITVQVSSNSTDQDYPFSVFCIGVK